MCTALDKVAENAIEILRLLKYSALKMCTFEYDKLVVSDI